MRRAAAIAAATIAVACGCRDKGAAPSATASSSPSLEPPTPPAAPPSATARAEGRPDAAALEADGAGQSDGACPADMALVQGRYCLTPEQRCAVHQDIFSNGKVVPNQCTRYVQPVVCYAERRKPLRYCMDRFEWPNVRGEKPRSLVSWQSAKAECAAVGKRLCTEEEFNFACEGEEMRPYVYGYARDPTQCNFDKPYRPRTFAFTAWDACMQDPKCHAAYDAIDQRTPAGSIATCRSPEGIYDLIGNVNEWVLIPDAKSPHRSGLKGGWWGPVRDRCRPTVTFHDEGDFGYEVGFRCCGDARESAPLPAR